MARTKQIPRKSTVGRDLVANAERQRRLMSISATAQHESDGSEYQDFNPPIQTQMPARKDQRKIKRRTVVGGTPGNQQTQNETTHEPSTVIKQLEERRDLARTVANVEQLFAESQPRDEVIANHGQQIARLNAQLSQQRTEIDSLKEELRVNNNLPNDHNNNRALEGMIREFKETELPVLKSLAKLLFSMEKIYQASAETGQEKDDFLTNIEKELGNGRYAYFLRIGKKICEQGLDFPELELYQAGEEDE
ncbi:hypothetical protein IWZ01DRAFT_483447 [Phyllosticta capitalensis]